MVALGTEWPHLFVVFASVAGILIGIRLRMAARMSDGSSGALRNNILQVTADRFFVYLLFTCLLGLVLGTIRYWRALPDGFLVRTALFQPLDAYVGYGLELFLAVCLSWYMYDSWKWHASKTQAAVMLGIWHRMKV
jgi:hypothetical protein